MAKHFMQHASSLECDTKHSKLLFQGRFLTDSETLEVAGVGDGHTVLLVPRPPAATASTSSSTSNSATGGARDVPSPPPEQ